MLELLHMHPCVLSGLGLKVAVACTRVGAVDPVEPNVAAAESCVVSRLLRDTVARTESVRKVWAWATITAAQA